MKDELLERIQAEWDKDSVIDTDNPNPLAVDQLHNKYWRHLVLSRQELIPAQEELDKLKYQKKQFFMNPTQEVAKTKKWDPGKWTGKTTKSDAEEYINADKDILDLTRKISKIEIRIELLEDIIKSIHNRNYLIRSFIEWEKFKSGK